MFWMMGKSVNHCRQIGRRFQAAKRFAATGFTVLGALLGGSSVAEAWSLKTHVWIAQEVLNDALDDGHVTLAGRSYQVPAHVLSALRAHPERYRMGALGPDVFPDLVVGQTTTHPGLQGGWQTDDWLRHLLRRAGTAEEVAFAYGFVSHAAADVFAHTWVNAFAGDIFELTDTERDVERRHFLLEKHVERSTPAPRGQDGQLIDLTTALASPTSFLRDVLIMESAVAGQYGRTPTALHLAGMFRVRQAAQGLDEATQEVISRLTSWAAQHFTEQLRLQRDLATGRTQLEIADKGLATQQEVLRLRREALKLAVSGVEEARKIFNDHPELINGQLRLLGEQANAVAQAVEAAAQIAASVDEAVRGLNEEIRRLRGEIADFACNALILRELIERCRNAVNDLNNKISGIESRINGENERKRLANEAAQRAKDLRDGTEREIRRLQAELDRATRGLTDGTLQAAVAAAELDQRAQEEVVAGARRVVDEARRVVERIEAALRPIDALVDEVKKAVDRYNLVTLAIRNWIGDMNRAAEEYIKTSSRVGIGMLNGTGDPLSEYRKWVSCWGQVFFAVPVQVGEIGCAVKQQLDRIQDEYNKAIDALPEVLRWLIAPSRELNRQAMRRLEPELRKAEAELLGFMITLTRDPATVELIQLLSDPSKATRERLIEVFRADGSGKRLLRFNDVAALVDKDLDLRSGTLNPAEFAPVAHSVTLSKLALLAPATINQLILDFTGDRPSPRFGRNVYPPGEANFSILLNMVRSIDGNHQWQAFGLPYPRMGGVRPTEAEMRRLHYGHNHFNGDGRGLRIWVDPFLRDRVFRRLFPGSMLGSLRDVPDLRAGLYPFPECPAELFPSTQDSVTGRILLSSEVCKSAAFAGGQPSPHDLAGTLPFEGPSDYAMRYFQCAQPLVGDRHWTVVASMRTRAGAERKRDQIATAFPDLAPQVWSPASRSGYWTVMLAGCVDALRANEARALAIRRGIATDAYVWAERAPWEPATAR